MVQIRPVSDLRNKYSEIESSNSPVFLTKNGYGSMVVMSLQLYETLTDSTELRLDEADYQAKNKNKRFSHEEVFSEIN